MKSWRKHLGPISAVLWVGAMLMSAMPVSASPGLDLSGALNVSWAQLLFIGATGAWAGRVNARLDAIEKRMDKKGGD